MMDSHHFFSPRTEAQGGKNNQNWNCVGSLLRSIPNGDKLFDFLCVLLPIQLAAQPTFNSLSDFHRSGLSLQSVKQKNINGSGLPNLL